MRISDATLELITTLRDVIRHDGGEPSAIAQELAKLPDFEGSRATAGYRVTPEGDIIDDHWWIVMDDDSVLDASDDEPVRCSKKDSRHGHYFPYTGETGIPAEVLQAADHLRAKSRTANNKSFSEILGEDGRVTSSDAARQAPEALPDNMTMDGKEGVPAEPFDDEVRPEDMQLHLDDLLDEDTWEHVEPQAGQMMSLDELMGSLSNADLRFVNQLENEPSEQPYLKNLQGSIAKYGMKTPITLKKLSDGTLHVPEGNHRIVIAKRMGMEQIPYILDGDLKEVDHPEYMPGGESGTNNYDPTYDERQLQTNPGHPRP